MQRRMSLRGNIWDSKQGGMRTVEVLIAAQGIMQVGVVGTLGAYHLGPPKDEENSHGMSKATLVNVPHIFLFQLLPLKLVS